VIKLANTMKLKEKFYKTVALLIMMYESKIFV